jgi:hypothetical protein
MVSCRHSTIATRWHAGFDKSMSPPAKGQPRPRHNKLHSRLKIGGSCAAVTSASQQDRSGTSLEAHLPSSAILPTRFCCRDPGAGTLDDMGDRLSEKGSRRWTGSDWFIGSVIVLGSVNTYSRSASGRTVSTVGARFPRTGNGPPKAL